MLGSGQKSEQRGAEVTGQCMNSSLLKTGTSETIDNTQKKTPAFNFSRPNLKTCSKHSDLQIQPSHDKHRRQLK